MERGKCIYIFSADACRKTERSRQLRDDIRDVVVISVGNHTTVNNCTHAYLRTYLKGKEKHSKKEKIRWGVQMEHRK